MRDCLVIVIMTLAFACPVLVQVENGAITGMVTDTSDARMPGVALTLRNVESGVKTVTETNAEGYYTLPYLKPGTYEIAVTQAGFKKSVVSDIKILVGLTATINIRLEIGEPTSETVVVEAATVQLERQSASLGNVVGAAQLTELPLSGRSPYALVTLAPGVMPAGNEGTGPIINGGRSNTSEVLLDGILIETAYVGGRGMHYWINRERNAVSTSYLNLGSQLNKVVDNPFYGKIKTGALSAATVRYSQLLRPWQHYQGITRFRDAVGDSIYHGFTLSVQKRRSRGLMLQGNYTISKQLDNARERFAGGGDFADPNNLNLYRAIVAFDRPHYLVMNYIYELPFGQGKTWVNNGWISRNVGNWQLSGITTIAKGVPLIITNNSANNTGLPGVSGNIANRSGDPLLPSDQRKLDKYFDTSLFSTPAAYALGNGSRTEPRLRGPGTARFDLGLFRAQKLWEGASLQFRLEAFNAFNRVNFSGPNTAVGNVDFGRITAAGGGRELQIGVRLSY